MQIIEQVTEIVEFIHRIQGVDVYLVGGAVRDYVIDPDNAPKDWDMEVFGVSPLYFEEILNQAVANGLLRKVDLIGVRFGVYNCYTNDNTEIQFALPRKDNRVGKGHNSFTVDIVPNMTLAEASQRRDFTCNSLSYSFRTGRISDPTGKGVIDIQDKVLRPINVGTFVEDPDRVHRAAYFINRFGFTPTTDLYAVCKLMVEDIEAIDVSARYASWKKILLNGRNVAKALDFLQKVGYFQKWVPLVYNMQYTPQDAIWHPEGNVWTHTLGVVQATAEMFYVTEENKEERLAAILAALFHDVGKPVTTVVEFSERDERIVITSKGHAEEGAVLCMDSMRWMGIPEKSVRRVAALVRFHMTTANSDNEILHLADKIDKYDITLRELYFVQLADLLGIGVDVSDSIEKVLARAELATWINCYTHKQPELLGGSDIMIMMGKGTKPGPIVGEIKALCYKHQLDNPGIHLCDMVRWLQKQAIIRVVTGNDLLDMGYKQGKKLGEMLNLLVSMQPDYSREELLEFARNA